MKSMVRVMTELEKQYVIGLFEVIHVQIELFKTHMKRLEKIVKSDFNLDDDEDDLYDDIRRN